MARAANSISKISLEFNGGLFDGRPPLKLEADEIGLLLSAANLDWSLIDPTIFGTLFERFLDPDKRAQIGAHYTDPEKIMMIVEPVIVRPLRAEWDGEDGPRSRRSRRRGGRRKGRKSERGKGARARDKAEASATRSSTGCAALRILDPACGSGNFLYLALAGASRTSNIARSSNARRSASDGSAARRARKFFAASRSTPSPPNSRAPTIWIGDIQWRVKHAITHHPQPDAAQARHDRMPRRAA